VDARHKHKGVVIRIAQTRVSTRTVMPAKAGIQYSLTHLGDYWIIRFRG
jgi:protease II